MTYQKHTLPGHPAYGHRLRLAARGALQLAIVRGVGRTVYHSADGADLDAQLGANDATPAKRKRGKENERVREREGELKSRFCIRNLLRIQLKIPEIK